MKFEVFCDYIVFPNGNIVNDQGYGVDHMTTTERMVKLNNEWYSLANLLAKLFLPFEEGCNHLRFRDGNMLNASLDNLELTDEPYHHKVKLTPEQRVEYADKIAVAIRNGLEHHKSTIEMIAALNGGTQQGVRAPLEYYELELNQKKSQFAPIVEVVNAETGCHVMTGSAKDINMKLGVNVYDTYKSYANGKPTKDGFIMLPIALVPKQYINANVLVKTITGTPAFVGTYSEVCQAFNLHYESLVDLLSYTEDEQVHYHGYTFQINPN